jgi:hypothetical protein
MCKQMPGNFVRIFVPTPLDPGLEKMFLKTEPRLLQVKLERATRLAVEHTGEMGRTFDDLVTSYVESKAVKKELRSEYITYGMEALR